MKYKVLCSILAAAMIVSGFAETTSVMATEKSVVETSVNASESEFDFDEKTGTILKYTGTDSQIVVPAQIDGVDVTTIGKAAFSSQEDLRNVTISEGISTIEQEAFFNCPNLSKVKIPDTVTTIGELAFAMCTSLEEIDLGGVEVLENNLFYGCEYLEAVTVPASVYRMSDHVFYDCVSLETVNISSQTVDFGEEIFTGVEKVKIVAPEGSQAQVFANAEGIGFEIAKTVEPTNAPTPTQSAKPTAIAKPTKAPQVSQKPTATPEPVAKTYDVEFELNGGGFEEEVADTYSSAAKMVLPEPVREGYSFEGWYTKSNFKGSPVTAIKKGSTGNKTFYAKWSKVTVKKVTISSVKNSKSKSMTVKIKKVTGAAGYQVAYATKITMSGKKVTSFTGTTKTIKKLTKGKRYYVMVRAYKLDSAGNKVYGKYQIVPKSVKIKK